MVLSGEKCGEKKRLNGGGGGGGGGGSKNLSGAAENTVRVFNVLSGTVKIQGMS